MSTDPGPMPPSTRNLIIAAYRYGVDANLGSPFKTTWANNVDDATGQPVG